MLIIYDFMKILSHFNLIIQVHPGYVDTDMSSHKGPLTPDQGNFIYSVYNIDPWKI